MEFCWSGVRGIDLARPAGVPNAGAAYCLRQLGIEPSEDKRCHLFLEVDHFSDNRHYCSNVPSKTMGSKTMETRVSIVILNVYLSTGIEKEEISMQSLESHGKLDEIQRFYNKKLEEGLDVHRSLARAEVYSKPTKR